MERRGLSLRNFAGLSEHLTRGCEIEPRMRGNLPYGGKDVVRAVDIDVHGREFILERIAHKALRCQVVALVRLDLLHHRENACIALERRRMQLDPVEQMSDPEHAMMRIFESDASHDSMDFVSLLEQQLGEVRTILSGDPGDECFGCAQSFTFLKVSSRRPRCRT